MVNELQGAAVMGLAFIGFAAFIIVGEIALAVDGWLYSRKLRREGL